MMKRVLIVAGIVFLTGCNGTSSDGAVAWDAGSSTGGGEEENEVCKGAMMQEGWIAPKIKEDDTLYLSLDDRMNYRFESSLTIRTVDVSVGRDLRFDWSELNVDMLSQPIDPIEDVLMMEVFLLHKTKEGVLQGFNDDDLSQSDAEAAACVRTGRSVSSAGYLDLQLAGKPLDDELLLSYLDPKAYPPEEYTFVVVVASSIEFKDEIRMIQFFRPVEGEENDVVIIDNDSTLLSYEADLVTAKRIAIPADRNDVVFGWSDNMEKNGMGRPFVPTRITDVMVTHFEDLTPPDLEDRFLEIENLADEIYRAEIESGTSVELKDLVDESGAQFRGLSGKGTWIFALLCDSCSNPAPWFLTVLEPC